MMSPPARHYLVIEHFRNRDPVPVYRRFRGTEGRHAPEGLGYVTSWITEDLTRCYQIMETADPGSSMIGWLSGPTWSILRSCRCSLLPRSSGDWLPSWRPDPAGSTMNTIRAFRASDIE